VTLVRFVALDETTSLPAVGDIGDGPVVAPENLSFLPRLRSAKLEKPMCAGVRELSSWKGATVALSKGERFEFETVCPSN